MLPLQQEVSKKCLKALTQHIVYVTVHRSAYDLHRVHDEMVGNKIYFGKSLGN